MEDKIKVAGEIAAHTYPLSEKSLCRLAAILEPRKLLKNELFLKEGDVARSMGVVEQRDGEAVLPEKKSGDYGAFYIRRPSFRMSGSFIRQIPGQFYVEALEPTLIYEIPYGPFHELMQQDPEILRVYCTILESSLIISQHKSGCPQPAFCFRTLSASGVRTPSDRPEGSSDSCGFFLGMSPETLSRIRAGKIS